MKDSVGPGIQTLNKLPVSKRLYKAVVENFFDATGLLDAQANIIYQTEASNTILGYGHGERVGKNAFDLMHPEDIPRIKKFFSKVVTNKGISDKTEFRYQHANGDWIYLEVFVTNLLDDESVNGIVFSYKDISDKKETEAALAQSNKIFKTLVDNLHEGIIRVDNEDVILYANEQFCQLTGYTEKELLGQISNKLLLDKTEIPRFKKIMELRKQGISSSYELQIRRKNGEYAWLLVSGSPFYDAKGNVAGSVGVNIDITERKEFEKQLQISETKYHQLARLSPVGIFRTDLKGKSIYANEKWCKIAGMSMDASNGDGWLKAVHPDDRKMVKKEWQDAVKNQRPSELEYRYKSPDGKITWVFGQAVLEYDQHGNKIGYIGTITDITEQKKIAQSNARGRNVLEALATGNSLEKILKILIESTEKSRPGMLCSILLIDNQNNQLKMGVAPSLPKSFTKALNGLEIGKGMGLCGEAAFTGKTVIAEDLVTHPNCAKRKTIEKIKKEGLRACWSEPIFSSSGKVIGILAAYYREPRKPGPSDLDLLKRTSYVAGIAIERKIAEDELLKSEQRNRAILNGVPDMIFHLSKEGEYLGFSPGKDAEPYDPPEKLLGNNIRNVLPPEITTSYKQAIKKAIKTKQVQLIEYSLGDWKDKNKSIFFESRVIAIGNDEVVAMVRDVTERKSAEDALRKSEQRNSALLGAVPEMIFRVSKDGTFLDYKPGNDFELLAPPEEFLGAKIKDILPPPLAKKATSKISKALKQKGEVQSFEYSLPNTKHPDQLGYFECRIIASGPEEVIILIRDITPRKENEIALLKSEERWRSMVENAPNFIAILDQDQKITFLNRINNIDPDSYIGLKAHETVDKKYQHELKQIINKVIEEGSIEKMEFSSSLSNGNKKWWSATYAPLKIPEDSSKVIVMAYDISDQKSAENQLKISNQKLKRLNHRLETIREEEKKIMAMEIHDQLGQELTAIKLGMFWIQQYLEENPSNPDVNALQEKTQMLIDLSSQTINSVRRIAHRLRPVVLDNLGLLPAIEWHINSLNKNTDINHTFQSNIQDMVFNKDCSTALFRIIQESLTNISRHSKATEADINLYKTTDELILLITDNGIGIKNNATNQPGKIGIFGIKERIKKWKGKFSIKGIKHKGTTLKISFPLSAIQ